MMVRSVLKQFTAGHCYSYTIASAGEAAIVDPHISLLDAYSEYLERKSLTLKFIIDTHTHADHFSLAAVLKKRYNVPLFMNERAVSAIVNRRLKDGDELKLGKTTIKIIATPGHTDDAISIHCEGDLLTGDALLIGSVGRTDFQNGSPESMFDTLQKLKLLPGSTRVYPGHDYHERRSSTIARETAINPFMKEMDRSLFIRNMRSKEMPRPFNIENIIRVNQKGQASMLEMIPPRDALESAKSNEAVKFLDVRSPAEYSEEYIKGSINIPIDALGARANELAESGGEYIVLCRTGNRSAMAADMLMQSGIPSVKVLDGGMVRWTREKLPVVKGAKIISIERQVRMAAGAMILSGIILSRIAHPAFIILSIFVSCGLIYSGITDNCTLGLILMKLPYNKKIFKPKSGGGTCAMG